MKGPKNLINSSVESCRLSPCCLCVWNLKLFPRDVWALLFVHNSPSPITWWFLTMHYLVFVDRNMFWCCNFDFASIYSFFFFCNTCFPFIVVSLFYLFYFSCCVLLHYFCYESPFWFNKGKQYFPLPHWEKTVYILFKNLMLYEVTLLEVGLHKIFTWAFAILLFYCL